MSIDEAAAVAAGCQRLEPRSGIGTGHRGLVNHVERGERTVLHLYGIEQERCDCARTTETSLRAISAGPQVFCETGCQNRSGQESRFPCCGSSRTHLIRRANVGGGSL